MKPMIGIFAEVDDELRSAVMTSYVMAIEAAGGLPVLLPYVGKKETLEEMIDVCDGFLFSGGADVAPERYGEEAKPTCGKVQTYRDSHEFSAFDIIIKTDKSILAICRGAQLVNVALGGTLYQDIPTEYGTDILHRQTEPKDSPSHAVTVMGGTPLFKISGGRSIMAANSFHHQAIKELGRGLSVMAYAADGIIEAVYLKGDRYLYAYQWHPERLCRSDEGNMNIFADFIRAASKKCEE